MKIFATGSSGRLGEVLMRALPARAGVRRRNAARGWKMLPTLDLVYVNDRARAKLGWNPVHDFCAVLARAAANQNNRSALAREIGSKGYHRTRERAAGSRSADRTDTQSSQSRDASGELASRLRL